MIVFLVLAQCEIDIIDWYARISYVVLKKKKTKQTEQKQHVYSHCLLGKQTKKETVYLVENICNCVVKF